MPQRAMVRIWVASLHQKSSSVFITLELFVLLVRETHKCGWIRTAAEPTAACGGNREARLGQRSAFSKPCQGAAEKAASATRKTRQTVKRSEGRAKTPHMQTKIRVCAQKPAPGSYCRPGAGFLCVKDSEKGKGGKREFQFYAAFAGAKTSAFFRRACIERTMQLRVKLMIK